MKTNSKRLWLTAAAAITIAATSLQAQNNNNGNNNNQPLANIERAQALIGKQVQTSDNKSAGKINDLVVALESGRVLYAVVSSGGNLVAVPPTLFSNVGGNQVRVNTTADQLKNAPQFSQNWGTQDTLGSVSFVQNVYQHFNQNEWWQGPNPNNSSTFGNVHKASQLDGVNVQNVMNQPVGHVQNVMVYLPAGRVPFVVINPDNSLNLGNNLYALPPNALTLSRQNNNVLISDINREKLAAAPHVSSGNLNQLSNPATASQIYQYYGKEAYFASSTAQNNGQNNQSTQTSENSQNTTSNAVSYAQEGDANLANAEKANRIIGSRVHDPNDHHVGNIQDVVVALESGRILYAVLDLGNRQIAVPPGALTKQGAHYQINQNQQALNNAPQFQKGQVNQVQDPNFASQVYQFFNQPQWWQGSGEFNNVHQVSNLKGMTVQNVSNQKIASVDSVVLDMPAARVVYVILNPANSLNLGHHLLALPPNALTLSQNGQGLVTGVSAQQLASAPKFEAGNWPNLSNTSFANQVYQYYGKQPWFGLTPTGNNSPNTNK